MRFDGALKGKLGNIVFYKCITDEYYKCFIILERLYFIKKSEIFFATFQLLKVVDKVTIVPRVKVERLGNEYAGSRDLNQSNEKK